MTKRKDAIALFDLISKGKSERPAGLSVPSWFSKRPAPPPAPDAGQPDSAEPPPMPEPSPFSPTAPYEPMLSVADNRVKISMNYATGGVVVAGLVVSLLFVFFLGRYSVRTSGPAPATSDAAGGRDTSYHPGADPNAALNPGERVKGKYYLIIDRMKGMTDDDKQDAVAIADYCQKCNYPCNVVKYGTQCYAVLSLKPFDSPGSREAMDYAKAIEDLGKKYKPPQGRSKYNFSQERSGRLDPSFHKE
jgi:hypothetical protein